MVLLHTFVSLTKRRKKNKHTIKDYGFVLQDITKKAKKDSQALINQFNKVAERNEEKGEKVVLKSF